MDTQKSSRVIISETDRLTDMVEDLLYISRIDTIAHEFEVQTNDLRETVEDCVIGIKSVAQKSGIAIIVDFDELPVILPYNEKHFNRAVLNLLSNAIRFAKHTVTVGCKNVDEHIQVFVEDDGDGIRPEDMPHIFERFYKGKEGKHGIGLSIAKSVILLHNGKIDVDCHHGTKFTITLPKQ
jgi:signal transduction histidine kinase